MSFSIKNIFQKGGSDQPSGGGMEPSPFGAGTMVAASPFSLPESNGGAPGFGSSLFKTIGNEAMDGAPIQPAGGGSPFSPFGGGGGTVLTVADLLPQLPPEVARSNGAMPDQPVSIAPHALEAAFSSGQLAVPLFEVFRACPAIFQGPVSPHDTRVVQLPKGKLPGMIASHTSALKPQGAGMEPHSHGSPFGQPMGNAAASPFAPVLPDIQSNQPITGGMRPAGTLPPRRPPGTPPAIPTQADFVGMNPPSLQLQPSPDMQHSHQQPPAPGASPFASMPMPPMPAQEPEQPMSPPTSHLFNGLNLSPSTDSFPTQPPAAHSPAPSPFASIPGGSLFATPSASGSNPQTQPLMPGARPLSQPLFQPHNPPSQPLMPTQRPMTQPLMPTGRPQTQPLMPSARPQTQPLMPFHQPSTQPMMGNSAPQMASPGMMPQHSTQPLMPTPMQPGRPSTQPLMPSMPGMSAQHSPFAQPMQAPAEQPPAFQQPAAFASFEVPQRQVSAEPHRLGNLPFSAQNAPSFAMGQSPSPFPGASQPTFTPPPAAGNEFMEVSLAAVLKGQSTHELGFDPNFIPAWINTKIPAAEVRQQLQSGQVTLDLGTIIDGTESSFRSVISHGRRDFKVHIAASEVFQNMPPAAAAPEARAEQPHAAPASPSPFAGFAPVSPSFTMPAMPQAQAPFAQPQPESAPVPKAFDPFAASSNAWGGKPGADPFASQEASPSAKPEGFSSAQLFASTPAAEAPAPFTPPAKASPTGPLFAPSAQPAPEPANPFLAAKEPEALAELESPAEAHRKNSMAMQSGRAIPVPVAATPVSKPAPTPAPVAMAAPAPAKALGSNPFGLSAAPDDEQMLLRALFGVSETLSADKVIQMVSRLPGVAACALVNGLKINAHGDSSPASEDFRQKAAEIANSMQTLSGLAGIDTETLSFAAGERLITFCFQKNLSFGVLHTDKEPPSGLREKITLISRELSAMPLPHS